jgi:hypothetical protein
MKNNKQSCTEEYIQKTQNTHPRRHPVLTHYWGDITQSKKGEY